ncbi:MAG: pilin [Candidatus Daviesbacteria bacterium]|nr:pilin [Candidatus Daviesbacteria bacterium]
MIKKIFILLIIGILYSLINVFTALASDNIKPTGICTPNIDTCVSGYSCQFDEHFNIYSCQPVFGKIQAPAPLAGFLKDNPTGASAISQFLSNFVVLIYAAAAIVLIFMLLWGAFEWMVSGGDKEKLSSAQKRIINAFIGILLFAVAFAVLQVLGQFTGFKFFAGQK